MTSFILKRSLQSLLVLVIMSLIVFSGVNLIGDPVDMLVNPDADQMEIERVIKDLGLDKPITEQYWYFVTNAVKGDLGRSFIFGEPALKLIVQRMPATIELALFSLFIAIVFGIPLGMYAGLKPNTRVSRTIWQLYFGFFYANILGGNTFNNVFCCIFGLVTFDWEGGTGFFHRNPKFTFYFRWFVSRFFTSF